MVLAYNLDWRFSNFATFIFLSGRQRRAVQRWSGCGEVGRITDQYLEFISGFEYIWVSDDIEIRNASVPESLSDDADNRSAGRCCVPA